MITRPQPRDIETLSCLPLLADMRPAEIEAMLVDSTVRTYRDDGLLFSVGDPADRFFAVLEGFVRLFALSENGDETIVEVIGAGQSFAEAAIFASGRYPVNAEAMSGSRIVSFHAATLLRLIRTDTQFGLRLLASLHRWHVHLMGEFRQLKGCSPAQRLAWHLLQLIDRAGGEAKVLLPYRKGVLAGRIGITPESLSRALARLGQIGVECHGDTVYVHDTEALRRFCRT